MSFWDDLKNPLYWLVKQDSRGAAELGRFLHWPGLTEEGKYNQKNPGSALTKAGFTAAAIMAPYLLGGSAAAAPAAEGAEGAAATGASAAYPVTTGMFANVGTEAAMTQEQLAQQAIARVAAERAAETAATQGAAAAPQIASQGMFSMVPGVANGSQQAQMLAAQTGDFGGYGANATAQAAKPAVTDAYNAGRMGTMDYAQQIAKGDMAGMNSPSVWMQRLAQNSGRLAGGVAKSVGTQMLMQSMAPGGGARPAPYMPARGGSAPPPIDQAKLETLKQRAMTGDQAALQELIALLGGKA